MSPKRQNPATSWQGYPFFHGFVADWFPIEEGQEGVEVTMGIEGAARMAGLDRPDLERMEIVDYKPKVDTDGNLVGVILILNSKE